MVQAAIPIGTYNAAGSRIGVAPGSLPTRQLLLRQHITLTGIGIDPHGRVCQSADAP